MGSSVLTYVLAPFKQPLAQYPGAFVGLAFLCIVVGFGLGRLPGTFRRRSLEKRLREAKDRVQRTEADARRYAELLGITANARASFGRLTNDQLRAKTGAFVSALHSQLAAWEKEAERRLAAGPPAQLADATAQEANRAWSQEAKRLQAESSAQLATYHERFKVDAVLLRTEISSRLQRPPERLVGFAARVSSPVNLTAMAEVAGDLDALVKLLPGDGNDRPRTAARRPRVRKRS
ncbi:MAG: hypothetical protein P8Y02_13085 [Deinococcales bacterium]